MSRRILIVLAITLLVLAPTAIATATAPSAGVTSAERASSSMSLAAASGQTVETRIEHIRHSQDGTRVAGFAAGAFKGKNVIIIQVESLNAMLLGKKYEGHEITPNLNKLINESWYWPNGYSETGMGNTVDAEFITNTSLYAPKGQATAVKYANRVLPAMPRIMKGLGYGSFTMHTNDVMYWNRRQLYQALGFAHWYDRGSFKGIPIVGGFGASDVELFKLGAKVLRGFETKHTPVYAQLITVSAHPPFIGLPESMRPMKTPKDLSGSLVGKYMSAESYTDMAIGKFVANLKTTGLWDNSIIVIYGDHTAMGSSTLTGKNAAGARRLLGRNYGPIDRQRIGLIVHVPGETTRVVRTDVAGQVDIMPTIADMVGADLTKVPHMGRSLFVDSNPLVPLMAYYRAGSFLNYRALFQPKSGSSPAVAYRIPDGGGTGVGAAYRADLARSNTLRQISDAWVMSLKTFNAGPKGWIPDTAARIAAKAYGFKQH